MAWTLAITVGLTLLLRAECVSFVAESKYDRQLQVTTENGVVQGSEEKTENGTSFFYYLGIPFAQPPLRNLRFRSPQPMSKWSGVLDATKEASHCVELHFKPTGIDVDGTEDCLYLNVFSPVSRPYKENLLPVFYWIQGGAFIEGNSGTKVYGPQYWLEQNLVVVTANYRVGMYGFLSTEDEASPGNYGLKDQNAVLKWIAKNIKNFGGDPNKVTITGESAGSCSVMHHLVSPMSKGLFHGVVAMSGDTLTSWCNQRTPRTVMDLVGMTFGIDTTNTSQFIERLRGMDSDVLMDGQTRLLIADIPTIYHNGLIWTPVVEPHHEEAFITQPTYGLLERGDFSRVPLIIGTTSMEMNLISSLLELLRPVLLFFDLSPGSIPSQMNIPTFAQRRLVGNLIRKRYFRANEMATATRDELLQFFSDVFFVMPVLRSARFISRYVPVYFYIISYKGEVVKKLGWPINNSKTKGVGHAEDLVYLWKTSITRLTAERDKVFHNRLTKLLSNFVKFGNPTPTVDHDLQNVTWPMVSGEHFKYLQLGEDLRVLSNYRGEYMEFWDRLHKKYARRPFITY